jgi:hypothetical protein
MASPRRAIYDFLTCVDCAGLGVLGLFEGFQPMAVQPLLLALHPAKSHFE